MPAFDTILSRMERLLLLVPIFVLHSAALFLLYRARALMHSRPYESDFVIFALPTILAFALYLYALRTRWRNLWLMRLWLALPAALVLTFLSFWAGMVACFSTYGS
jgi:hypothetical protein